MKKINVIVKERNILELMEDATRGDVIDLEELVQVDTSYIESIIESGKDKVYQSKLENEKRILDLENQKEIVKLKNEIEELKKENITNIKIKEQELNYNYQKEISDLNNKICELEKEKITDVEKNNKESQIKLGEYKLEQERKYQDLEAKYKNLLELMESKIKEKEHYFESKYMDKIQELKTKNEILAAEKENKVKEVASNLALEKEKEFNEIKEKYQAELKIKEDKILELQRAKSILNSKQIGEDLEIWCDNEVQSYKQNGLFNCTWEKDNEKVKGEDDSKGTKADFIFKIYADNNKREEDLLTSICFDMKDENPESKTKQTNKSFYSKLDEDRNKKGCKYAVLVSNLETDKSNALPIYKVNEFEDMYVVRPAYLMTFINMVVSLTTKFGDLVLSKEKETIELRDKLELIENFNKLKADFLDKPLESLDKQITSIIESTKKIRCASDEIDNYCEKIRNNYISKIEKKIKDFTLKSEKQVFKNLE